MNDRGIPLSNSLENINSNGEDILLYIKRNSIMNIFASSVDFKFKKLDDYISEYISKNILNEFIISISSERLLIDVRYNYLKNILLFNDLYRKEMVSYIAYDITLSYINLMNESLNPFYRSTIMANIRQIASVVNFKINAILFELRALSEGLMYHAELNSSPEICSSVYDRGLDLSKPIYLQNFKNSLY